LLTPCKVTLDIEVLQDLEVGGRRPAEREPDGEIDLGGDVAARLPLHALGEVAGLRRHEAVVQEREGLEGRDALVALLHPHRGIGTVEHGHEGLRLAADNEPIHAPPPGGLVLRVGKVVAPVGRVLRVLDLKILPAGAAHREVERAGDCEHGVAHRLSLELAPVLPPEILIARIDCLERIDAKRGLPVGRGIHDQPVQRLERAAAVAKLGRQPVEQFGMRGSRAHPAKIARGGHDPLAEVVVPHAVHDAPPGERILRIGEPAGERRAAVALGVVGRQVKPALERLHEHERAGPNLVRRREHVAPGEHVDRPRHALANPRGDGVGHLHRRQFFLLLGRGRQIRFQLLELGGHGRTAMLREQLFPLGLEGENRGAGGRWALAVGHVRPLPTRG
jgi:hypothetical protein